MDASMFGPLARKMLKTNMDQHATIRTQAETIDRLQKRVANLEAKAKVMKAMKAKLPMKAAMKGTVMKAMKGK